MAKKKKTALKPVARGFATTSQAKKVVPESSQGEPAAAEDAVARDTTQEGVAGVNGTDKLNGGLETGEGVDWEDDAKLEQGVYQGYVERLQDKGDREVAKILKTIDFDKRTKKGYIRLDIEPSLRDEILEADRERRAEKTARVSISSDPTAKEKQLLRMYIIYRVLTKLGYPEATVLECLKCLGEKDNWEDGLNWLYLHEHYAKQQEAA
ncbi:hypothetical protein NCC49_000709 [Naganishia albida]|nr:hypothetical protein NCC49_000709 [Naganishia albida]